MQSIEGRTWINYDMTSIMIWYDYVVKGLKETLNQVLKRKLFKLVISVDTALYTRQNYVSFIITE